VVTVVDAVAGVAQLARYEEARDQVSAADHILISKLDSMSDSMSELANAESLAELHRRLHDLNPDAERAAFPANGAGTAALVPWLLQARPKRLTARTRSRTGGHSHQLAAATYVDDAPLIGQALILACASLGDRLVRAKGHVFLAGEPRRGFLDRSGGRTRLDLAAPWGDETPLTRLVLIGEELDEAALHRQLWACRAYPPAATTS
jgi:G3E family GTPase